VAAKLRRHVDPKTRDYTVESGGFKADAGYASQILLALGMERGSCPVFPEFGSRLHLVKKADDRGRRESEAYATEALSHLAGKLDDLVVTATLSTARPGAIEIEVAYRLGNETLRVPFTSRAGAV
jgi:phage gp46-like protein